MYNPLLSFVFQGLGKTLQVLAFLAHLCETRIDYGPHLIIVPLSVLHNWKADATTFAPALADRMFLYHGAGKRERSALLSRFIYQCMHPKRSASLPTSSGAGDNEQAVSTMLGRMCIVVTTFEMAIRDAGILHRIAKWRYLVVDEGHRLKSHKAKLAICLRLISAPRRLLLTGTPLQNNLQELWSLLSFVMVSNIIWLLRDSHLMRT